MTGENFSSLQYVYRIPAQTIGKIAIETCLAIVDSLEDDYLKVYIKCTCTLLKQKGSYSNKLRSLIYSQSLLLLESKL